ncbi:hypothetical protein SLEP1_g5496 [Rubroshorea leprosula]|uniref:Uncharacterized protein n=1 Tax=Rubroshorea leprosula TaxID=152421 RepID=A0AAV5HY21_9ROSI|nr:hypothetical protein SLEP1_g5496 [Rubroshorea leprosula]
MVGLALPPMAYSSYAVKSLFTSCIYLCLPRGIRCTSSSPK